MLLEPGQEITAGIMRDRVTGAVAFTFDLPARDYTWQDIADLASVYPPDLAAGRPITARWCVVIVDGVPETTLIVEPARTSPEHLSMEEADIVASGMLEPTQEETRWPTTRPTT